MLKIDRTQGKLERLDAKTLSKAKLLERSDLQRMIVGNAGAFFAEMDEDLLLVGQEVCPSELVGDRIDLLAIDSDGASVVIELKRSEQKLQLLQALSYAAMLSQWVADDFVRVRSEFAKEPGEDARKALREHVTMEDALKDDINTRQRVILVAEAFDYALLQTADWLTRTYEVDIKCYKFSYVQDGASEYVSCNCIYPPPELEEQASRIRRRKSLVIDTSWDELLSNVSSHVGTFFRKELQDKAAEDRLRYHQLLYRIKGKRRFRLNLRRDFAYAVQVGRFENDLQFWRSRLSEPNEVMAISTGDSIRFYLTTDRDFLQFKQALENEISTVSFTDDRK